MEEVYGSVSLPCLGGREGREQNLLGRRIWANPSRRGEGEPGRQFGTCWDLASVLAGAAVLTGGH